MKKKVIEGIEDSGIWDWMFSDRAYEDGETYDLHWLFNKYTGDVKMVITKRIEVEEDKKEIIFRG